MSKSSALVTASARGDFGHFDSGSSTPVWRPTHLVSVDYNHSTSPSLVIGGFRGGKGAMPLPPNLAHNKFQERPSGASRMQETF